MSVRSLPTMDEMNATRRAEPRSAPPVVRRITKRQARKSAEDTAKDAVWDRDGGCSRASGKSLVRAHTDPRRRGEVAHLTKRSTNPRDLWKLDRLVLLSAEEHQLSDPRTANAGGKVLLEILGTNGNQALTFVRRDVKGVEKWRRTSRPVKAV